MFWFHFAYDGFGLNFFQTKFDILKNGTPIFSIKVVATSILKIDTSALELWVHSVYDLKYILETYDHKVIFFQEGNFSFFGTL